LPPNRRGKSNSVLQDIRLPHRLRARFSKVEK